MENGYYTPELEDICVGYECEYLFDNAVWQSGFGLDSAGFPSLTEIKIMGIKNILRTPYLTKQQIEAEGWRLSKDNYNGWEFDKWELEFSYDTKNHKIDIWKGGQKPPQNLFYGECKSINEFRKICKWLNIN